MAIDSQKKRMSATMFLMPGYAKAIDPDGVHTQADRQEIAWVYSGISAYTPTAGAGEDDEPWQLIILMS